MNVFIIEETLPCWVTWRRTVKAENEKAALAAFNEGEGDPVEGPVGYPEIGDMVDGYDIELKVVAS